MKCPDDPLSLVYTELWNMAEATPALVAAVKLKNRIRYDRLEDRDPEKRTYTDADVPELVLMCAGLSGNICNTSSTSMITVRYSWMIITGDLRANYRMMPVEWALFLAMHNWRERLGKLLWHDKPFCKHLNMREVEEGVIRPNSPQEGPRGWAAIWGIEVGMYFALTDIDEEISNGCS